MKYMAFVLSVALIGGAGAARAEDKPADPVAQGKQLVEKSLCLVCHMVDGKGGKIGKPLNGAAEGKTDQFLHDVLADAKKTLGPDTKMPPYKDKFNDEQIKAVIEYLKTLKKQ